MSNTVQLTVTPENFRSHETPIAEGPGGSVTGMRYASGVEALRIVSDRVEVVVLPFRGQQIWRYMVDGEDLTMETTFTEPEASTNFGESYGAFLVHCGLTGIGAPGPEDAHLHHGELPTANCGRVTIRFGSDGDDSWVELVSPHAYKLSHAYSYQVELSLRVTRGSTILKTNAHVRNKRRSGFDLAYLCHINWALEEPLVLSQSVPNSPEAFVWAPHPQQDSSTAELLDRYAHDRAASDQLDPSIPVVPEYCAILSPTSTSTGRAEFMGQRPDGSAFWVSFSPERLPRAIRWISNTKDEHAAGFCLPATGNHFGRSGNEEANLLVHLDADQTIDFEVQFGLLSEEEAVLAQDRIAAVQQ